VKRYILLLCPGCVSPDLNSFDDLDEAIAAGEAEDFDFTTDLFFIIEVTESGQDVVWTRSDDDGPDEEDDEV
jgi:hypothetical protein